MDNSSSELEQKKAVWDFVHTGEPSCVVAISTDPYIGMDHLNCVQRNGHIMHNVSVKTVQVCNIQDRIQSSTLPGLTGRGENICMQKCKTMQTYNVTTIRLYVEEN